MYCRIRKNPELGGIFLNKTVNLWIRELGGRELGGCELGGNTVDTRYIEVMFYVCTYLITYSIIIINDNKCMQKLKTN